MKLTRPLWNESPEFRRWRRLRFAFLAPVAAFAGGLWGTLVGGGAAVLGGAAVFTLGAWLHTRLHPALLQWAQERWGHGRAAAFLWETVAVGGAGLVLTRGFGLPWSPAVASALAIGGGTALAFAWFFDEGGTRAFHSLLSPLGRPGPPRVPFSRVEALLSRRDFPAARDALEELLDEHPQEAQGWILLARVLAGPLEEPEAAARTLEDGLRAVRGSSPREQQLLRQLVVLRKAEGHPLKAAPFLARYGERWGDGAEGVWARETLAALKEEELQEAEGGPADAPWTEPGRR